MKRFPRPGFPSLALVSAALLACSSDPATAPSSVAVDMFVDDAGLRITRVYSVEDFPIARGDSPRELRYELRDDDDQVVVEGVLPDFRYAHSEGQSAGAMDRFDAKFGFGGGSIRLPHQAGTLVVIEPGPAGGIELGRARFNPDTQQGRIRQALLQPDDILGSAEKMAGSLDPDAAVDLLFLGDGYTEEQIEDFHADAEKAFADFIALPYYADYKERFNAWRQDVRSTETGIDDPDGGVALDTAFDFGFGMGDLRRCVFFNTGEGQQAARDLGTAANADVVVVIGNTAEYGGCAVNGVFSVTKDPASAEVVAHELGHALLSLADEYDYGSCREPNSANVTKESSAVTVPWSDLLTDGITMPTPAGTGGVGAFEGGSYCPTGVFRPQDNCLMRTLSTPMCAVCARERDRFFSVFGVETGSQLDCPFEWRDDGICDLCFGENDPDPDCPILVCDRDNRCDTADGEDCGSCPEDCGSCGGEDGGCGDSLCLGDENDENCGIDCGCASIGQCDTVAGYGCWCDVACTDFGDCCADVGVCER